MNIALNVPNNKELFLTKNKFIFKKNDEYLNSNFKPTYKSCLVEKENFAMSDNERAISYAYDDLGRLLAVNYFKEQTHNYEYDYRGYLISDNNLSIEYDTNNPLIPTKYLDKRLKFEEKDLKK